jgi:hypothetical protein
MSSIRVHPAVLVEALRNRHRRAADFPYMLKAAFGRGPLRAGSLRSPVLAGQHRNHEHA